MCLLQTKSPFFPSVPWFFLHCLTPFLPPCLLQSHGQITWVWVRSQLFLRTAAALHTLEKWSEICKGTISVQWICPFLCSVKSLPSLTRVKVFEKSLRQCSGGTHEHFAPEIPKGAKILSATNDRPFSTYCCSFGILQIRTKNLFFLQFFSSPSFSFLLQAEDEAAW